MQDNWTRRAVKRIARIRYAVDLEITRRLRGRRRFRLEGTCNRCGKCCRTPTIQVFPLILYMKHIRRLILAWHRVINGFRLLREDRKSRVLIFRCTHWDPKTGLCDSYESRPGMCRDYPRILLESPQPEFFDTCGYYPVLNNAARMRRALENLGLPEERLSELERDLHLDGED